MASIASNDALILPHRANPSGWDFRERQLLLRRLLRIRGLAASGNEGRARDGSDKCPFSKRNASGGLRLSRRITVHGCSSLVAPPTRPLAMSSLYMSRNSGVVKNGPSIPPIQPPSPPFPY